jgi:hypothetical protein
MGTSVKAYLATNRRLAQGPHINHIAPVIIAIVLQLTEMPKNPPKPRRQEQDPIRIVAA